MLKNHILLSGLLFAQIGGMGGLGVRCLSKLNRALLCKWWWRLLMREKRCGEMLLNGSLGRRKGDRPLELLGELMGQESGRKSERNGILCSLRLFSP